MAFADKLDQLLLRGSLSDVQEGLHRPTSSVPDSVRLSKRCTTSPLSILDSSTSYGTLLVGCAALARRSFAFRLACFSMILERGANPFARGTDGRAVSWVLDSVKNPAERQCFEEELNSAKQAWRSGEKYEIAPDICEWIEDSLALIEEEKREALERSKRDAFVQSPQEIVPAVTERAPTSTPPPAKRPRFESPAPENPPSSQNESLPDCDEVVTGVKAELVESKLPPSEPTPATREPAPPKTPDETVAQPAQTSQDPSTTPASAVPPIGAPSASFRLSRLPPGVVQGPQVQPQPVLQPTSSRHPPPPPSPPAPDTPVTVAAPTPSAAPAAAAPALASSSLAPQPAQATSPAPSSTIPPAPAVAPAPVRRSRLPAHLLGRPPPALRIQTSAPPAPSGSPASQSAAALPAAATPSGASAKESAHTKVSPSVARLPPTAQIAASAPKAPSTSRLPPALPPSSELSASTSLPQPSASPASKPPTSPAPVPPASSPRIPSSSRLPPALVGSPPTEPAAMRRAHATSPTARRLSTGRSTSPRGSDSRPVTGLGLTTAQAPPPTRPRADPMTIQFCDVPGWMTTRLFQHYLLHGPTKYLHARPEELQHLEDLVECGSFVPTRREDDEIPPIPSGVKISRELREKSGRLVGQATYSSRTEAERAKRMFDGARVLGRVAETPLLCIDLDMQRDIASWRERVMPQS